MEETSPRLDTGPEPQPALPHGNWYIVSILVLAAGLRLAWVLLLDRDRFLPDVIDSIWYVMEAKSVLKGTGFVTTDGSPTAYFAPGYSILLAGIFGIFGDSLVVPKLFNVAVGTLTCGFIYLLGRRVYGEGCGIIAAGIYAVFPGSIAYSSLLITELAFQCAFVGALLVFFPARAALDAQSSMRVFFFGMALGAASLIRGIALPFLPVPIFVWMLGSLSWRDGLRRSVILALGLLVFVGPWMIRNYRAMDGAILFTSDGALALIHGHSPIATGGHVLGMAKWRRQEFAELFELPDPEREVALSKAQLRYALRWAWEHPRRELELLPSRFYHFYAGDHWAFAQYNQRPKKGSSSETFRLAAERRRNLERAGWLASAYFFTVLALAVGGLFRIRWRPTGAALLIPLTLLYFTFAHSVLFFGSMRFHMPIIPILCLLASVTLRSGLERWGTVLKSEEAAPQ